MQIASCNACKRVFEVSQDRITQIEDGEIHFRYLGCPACGSAFLIDVTNAELRRLMVPILAHRADSRMQKKARSISAALKAAYSARFAELVPSAYFEDKESAGK